MDHPKIVKVLNVLQTETNMYIVFEYCSLGTIKELMFKQSRFTNKQVAFVIR